MSWHHTFGPLDEGDECTAERVGRGVSLDGALVAGHGLLGDVLFDGVRIEALSLEPTRCVLHHAQRDTLRLRVFHHSIHPRFG